jgi:23S rRNA pseudouridine1911/1915/1917 synthase
LLFLDSSLAVVDKGPGLISVPTDDSTISALSILEDFLAGRLKAQDRSVAGKGVPAAYRNLRPWPVHRLDQFTSGVFCMGMNPSARQQLIEQVRTRKMKRQYIGFVEGRVARQSGVWRDWVALDREGFRQHVVAPPTVARTAGRRGQGAGLAKGRALPGSEATETVEAVTHYEVMAEYPLPDGRFATKLRLRLDTGRKHQIRVQAAHAGVPLIGDRIYNPEYQGHARRGPHLDFSRQALHAHSLTLEHPEQTGQWMTWTSDLPNDLRDLERELLGGGRYAGASAR